MGSCCNGETNPDTAEQLVRDRGHAHEHACSLFCKDPNLRNRKEFGQHCHKCMRDAFSTLPCKDESESRNCWDAILQDFEANTAQGYIDQESKLNFDSDDEEDNKEAANESSDSSDDDLSDNENKNQATEEESTNNSSSRRKKRAARQKVDESDAKFSAKDFWQDLTGISDDIVHFFDKKLERMMQEMVIALMSSIVKILHNVESIPITIDEVYHLLRGMPLLSDLLPEDTHSRGGGVIPSPEFKFHNWGLTVQNNPAKIAVLQTEADIIALLAEARENNKRVRVTAYSHSWSHLYADDGEYCAKMLPDKWTSIDAQQIPLLFNDDLTEVRVENWPLIYCRLDLENNRVFLGGATPIHVYVSLVDKRVSEGLYTFPAEFANVIMGLNSMIAVHCVSCHGSGLSTTNITQYVRRFDVIDARGEKVVYEGREMLDKVGNHFGLLGVVTELELQFRKAYFAMYKPHRASFKKYFPKKGKCKKLQRAVEKNYYNEYFWWPQTKKLYVNDFMITEDPSGVEIHPTKVESEFHIFGAQLIQFLTVMIPRQGAHGPLQKLNTQLMGNLALYGVDQYEKATKIPSAGGLHFRHGIQYFRVLDMEWALPLPTILNESTQAKVPDMKVARDLFWACKKLLKKYEHEKECYPQMQPVEMRVISGDTSVALCNARGADFFCMIEVLTILGDEDANRVWYEYCQELADKWLDIIEARLGKEALMLCRPHWAKDWQKLTVRGRPMIEHLRLSYKNDLGVFEAVRKEADPNKMFMNSTWDQLLS